MAEKRKREVSGAPTDKKLQTLQKKRDAEFWLMSEASLMFFIVHLNECTTPMENDDEETLARIKTNITKADNIVASLIAKKCDIYAPGVDKTNAEEIAQELGMHVVYAMNAVQTNNVQQCNNYARKALIYESIGNMEPVRAWVLKECEGAPKFEKDRAYRMASDIIELTRELFSGALPTSSPDHSEIKSFVTKIDTQYRLLAFQTYHVLSIVHRQAAYRSVGRASSVRVACRDNHRGRPPSKDLGVEPRRTLQRIQVHGPKHPSVISCDDSTRLARHECLVVLIQLRDQLLPLPALPWRDHGLLMGAVLLVLGLTCGALHGEVLCVKQWVTCVILHLNHLGEKVVFIDGGADHDACRALDAEQRHHDLVPQR